MPYEFRLPSSTNLNFTKCFQSQTHPAFPQLLTVKRNLFRRAIQDYSRSKNEQRAPLLEAMIKTGETYISHLFTLQDSLNENFQDGEPMQTTCVDPCRVNWKSSLSKLAPSHPTKKIEVEGLRAEITMTLIAYAIAYILRARRRIQSLYTSITPSVEDRTNTLQSATQDLLLTSSVHLYLANFCEETDASTEALELLSQTHFALSELAIAEATLLAVLKDDSYIFAVAQTRNKNDKEWMIKPPEIPKVRAHLFARLCLAAADHAAKAEAGLSASGKIDNDLTSYIQDLRQTCQAKACRFLGIDAELEGETGKAIAWLRAGKISMGFKKLDVEDQSKWKSLKKMKKDWNERREDRKVAEGASWGQDAGKMEELRVIEHLEAQWTKMNDTINTQIIPASAPLLATIPSGREIHSPNPFVAPRLTTEQVRLTKVVDESMARNFSEGEVFEDGYSSDNSVSEVRNKPLPGSFPKSVYEGRPRRPAF